VNLNRNDGNLLDSLSLLFVLLLVLLLQVSENIVEDKVTVGLFGEEEGLSEFSPSLISIRHFTNDENNDTASGR
jgi:hypothetical protein